MKKYLAILLALTIVSQALGIERNVASQKVYVTAIDSATGRPKTGLSDITLYVAKDGGTLTALGDTSATEYSSTNAPGVYWFDITQAETSAACLLVTGKSSTSGVDIIPQTLYTTPANFSLASIDSSGRLDLGKWLGTAIATPDTAGYPKVTVKSGTGTGEILTSSGVLVNVALVNSVAAMGAGSIESGDFALNAGVGLAGIPWNSAWDAEVQSEADDALAARGVTSARMGYVDNINNPALATLSNHSGRVWYVAASGGSDANSGLTRSAPFATFAAANTAATAGDTVWFMAGNHTGPIAMDKSLHLRGDGRASSFISASADGAITLEIPNASLAAGNGFSIKHLGVVSASSNPAIESWCIKGDDLNNGAIEDVYCVGNNGIDLGGDGRGVFLRHVKVDATDRYALHVRSGTGMRVEDSYLFLNTSRDVDAVAIATSGSDIVFDNVRGLCEQTGAHDKETAAFTHRRGAGTVSTETSLGLAQLINCDLRAVASSASNTGPVAGITYSLHTGDEDFPFLLNVESCSVETSNAGSGEAVGIRGNLIDVGSTVTGRGLSYSSSAGNVTVYANDQNASTAATQATAANEKVQLNLDAKVSEVEGGGGTPAQVHNEKPVPAFTAKLGTRADGVIRAYPPINVTPTTEGHIWIDCSKLLSDNVENVTDAESSDEDVATVTSVGPYQQFASIKFSSSGATAGDTATFTCNVPKIGPVAVDVVVKAP